MAEESPFSSSSSPSSDLVGISFDVFLSFRGPDTRLGFTDILYHRLTEAGIRVFRDEEELPVGEEIEPALIEAIKRSRIMIPIISRDYASSKSCLMQLVQILECKKTMNRDIIPVFYEIDPSDLIHQRKYFAVSFLRHERQGFDSEILKQWRQAVKEIGSIKGFATEKMHGHLSMLIDELISVVLQKVKKGRLVVPKNLVGVDRHVQEIMRRLGVEHHNGKVIKIHGNDVRVLGIYGVGGVGKSTLAKVVYNQLYGHFQGCSYVRKIQELCQSDGILSLQNQLISDLRKRRASFESSGDAMAYLAEGFHEKQVLILLDDVEDVDQLDKFVGELSWFGQGSRIIVTSRKSDVLLKFKEAETYKVEPMEEDEALELFSKLAFARNSTSEGFENLSREIILATEKIPLALEVTGSRLFGKPQAVWRDVLLELRSNPHKKVEEQVDHLLETSYNALEENAKQIFLTIVSLDIRKDKENIFCTWQDSKLDIELLLVVYFIKIGENEELWMHDQLRSLGRKIVSNEDPISPYPQKKKKSEVLELPNSPFELLATIEHVISIEDRVKEVIKFLQIDDEGGKPRMVVICGTGGIGKTTIAKAVYNRLSSCFDSCSFLAEIGETAQDGGIQCVQTKLIHDILERDGDVASFEGGIEFFLDVFSNVKALIVLDDVVVQSHLDELVGNQLDWFGLGSRIIVTSENDEILKTCASQGRACIYDVKPMDQALELLWKHALGTQGSISDYLGIGERIIEATGKLPLVIEVIGSLLHGKTIEDWKNMVRDLIELQTENSQEIREDCWEILEILKICYKKLHEEQKKIFWDIAWFANGEDSRIASYMWPDQDFLPSHHVLMPLAKIGVDNMLRMHKLLKCHSRIIDPVKCGRLYEKVTDLKEIKEAMVVEALCFDCRNSAPHTFTKNDFMRMPNIRFLKLDHAIMTGSFAEVIPKLKWLHWRGCPNDFKATELNLTELIIFDLSWSKVTEDWGGWGEIKMEQLKVLDLTGCTDLLISPTFSSFPNLEILILERCSQLVHLDPSVGGLKKLLRLNLKSCIELNRLPDEVGALKALKELLIDETSVRIIPLGSDSKELETLSASNCVSLCLPNGVGELVKLRRLSLRNCHWIQRLPESIGQSPLEELDISGTGIFELPDSFGNLQRLRVLKMDHCFISKFPSFIWHLHSIEEVHASSCRNIEGEIPGDIRNLKNLRILRLRNSAISSLPSEIKDLPKLETLDVLHCDMLHELPALPSSLVIVHLSPELKKKVSHIWDKHCFISV